MPGSTTRERSLLVNSTPHRRVILSRRDGFADLKEQPQFKGAPQQAQNFSALGVVRKIGYSPCAAEGLTRGRVLRPLRATVKLVCDRNCRQARGDAIICQRASARATATSHSPEYPIADKQLQPRAQN